MLDFIRIGTSIDNLIDAVKNIAAPATRTANSSVNLVKTTVTNAVAIQKELLKSNGNFIRASAKGAATVSTNVIRAVARVPVAQVEFCAAMIAGGNLEEAAKNIAEAFENIGNAAVDSTTEAVENIQRTRIENGRAIRMARMAAAQKFNEAVSELTDAASETADEALTAGQNAIETTVTALEEVGPVVLGGYMVINRI